MAILIARSYTANTLYGDGATSVVSVDFRGDIAAENTFSYGFVTSSTTPEALLSFTGDDGTVHHYPPTSAVLEGTVVTFTFPGPLPVYPHAASVSVTFGF